MLLPTVFDHQSWSFNPAIRIASRVPEYTCRGNNPFIWCYQVGRSCCLQSTEGPSGWQHSNSTVDVAQLLSIATSGPRGALARSNKRTSKLALLPWTGREKSIFWLIYYVCLWTRHISHVLANIRILAATGSELVGQANTIGLLPANLSGELGRSPIKHVGWIF
jgi:hypothetical protein